MTMLLLSWKTLLLHPVRSPRAGVRASLCPSFFCPQASGAARGSGLPQRAALIGRAGAAVQETARVSAGGVTLPRRLRRRRGRRGESAGRGERRRRARNGRTNDRVRGRTSSGAGAACASLARRGDCSPGWRGPGVSPRASAFLRAASVRHSPAKFGVGNAKPQSFLLAAQIRGQRWRHVLAVLRSGACVKPRNLGAGCKPRDPFLFGVFLRAHRLLHPDPLRAPAQHRARRSAAVQVAAAAATAAAAAAAAAAAPQPPEHSHATALWLLSPPVG
ncbi:uncharacterized protein LOC131906169 [Peromyscus eremicus]|uniref:uncharacterized protein LOC131906169 n=1 Tax=Peromyscus eremicus TaxID=42410 RepID=UPI0027DAC586|nr:uncharacterized protein LOC131906169 [Peromyscus eremicus]